MSSQENIQSGFWVNFKEISILLFLVFLIRSFGFGLYQVPTGSMETTMLVGERFFADKLTPIFLSIKREEVISFNDPLFSYSKNKIIRLFQDYVWGPSNWTKRVIGIPGDEITGAIENGKPIIYRNGKKLNESYVNKYPLIRVWKIDSKKVNKIIQKKGLDSAWEFMIPKTFDPNVSPLKQPFYKIKEDRIVDDNLGQAVIYPATPIRPSSSETRYEDGENYWSGSDQFHVKLKKNQFWVMGDNRLGSKDSRWFGPISGRLIHGRIVYRIWSIDSDEAWWMLDVIKHPIEFWSKVRWKRFFQRVL